MVIRVILRHIQNALVLSSALLVILALQQLHHYEFRSDSFLNEHQQHQQKHHYQRYQDLQHYQQYEGFNPLLQHQQPQQQPQHESLDTFGMDTSHKLRFGMPFQFGLFTFFVTKIERIAADEETASRQNWEITEAHTLIHYLVELQLPMGDDQIDCQAIDAAGIFAHSHRKKSGLHAIVNDTLLSHCNATSWLATVGYNVILTSSIPMQDGCTDLWQNYALQNLKHVDVVVRVPFTALYRHEKQNVLSKELSPNFVKQQKRKRRQRALSSSIYSSMQFIQLLRPKSAAAHNNDCRSISPTVCQSPSYQCQLKKHIAILLPSRKCPMPWTCPNSSVMSSSSSSCRAYHDMWSQHWNELMHSMRNSTADQGLQLCANNTYQSIFERA